MKEAYEPSSNDTETENLASFVSYKLVNPFTANAVPGSEVNVVSGSKSLVNQNMICVLLRICIHKSNLFLGPNIS